MTIRFLKIVGLVLTVACWLWARDAEHSPTWNLALIWCSPLLQYPITLLGRRMLDIHPDKQRAGWASIFTTLRHDDCSRSRHLSGHPLGAAAIRCTSNSATTRPSACMADWGCDCSHRFEPGHPRFGSSICRKVVKQIGYRLDVRLDQESDASVHLGSAGVGRTPVPIDLVCRVGDPDCVAWLDLLR